MKASVIWMHVIFVVVLCYDPKCLTTIDTDNYDTLVGKPNGIYMDYLELWYIGFYTDRDEKSEDFLKIWQNMSELHCNSVRNRFERRNSKNIDNLREKLKENNTIDNNMEENIITRLGLVNM